jgi:malate dehydrogenase
MVVVATETLNMTLPLVSQAMMKHNCYNLNKVFGCTTGLNMRSNSIYANHLRIPPENAILPVIGGASEGSIVPVFSQARPQAHLRTVTIHSFFVQNHLEIEPEYRL